MKKLIKYLPTLDELFVFFLFMLVMLFVLATTIYIVSFIYEGI